MGFPVISLLENGWGRDMEGRGARQEMAHHLPTFHFIGISWVAYSVYPAEEVLSYPGICVEL